MRNLHLFCPAKLNLYLRVLGKRRDGFHEIVTLFHRISLADEMSLERTEKGFVLECEHPGVPLGRKNILWRAYKALKDEVCFEGGVKVFLKKRIPIAAGLGGGSSDGASLLGGLNSLFEAGLKKEQLMTIGKKVGADVPFFLSEASYAIGRGIGETIEAVSGLPRFWYVLTVMPFGLSTAEVYRGLQRCQKGSQDHFRKGVSLTKVSCDVSMLCAFLRSRDFSWISRLLVNDLSKPAMVQKPALKRVLSFLRREVPVSMMSGSGPTLFSLVRSRDEGVSVQEKVKAQLGLDSVLCRGT